MIVFGFIAIAMLIWTLNISYQLNVLRASSESLAADITDAATSCGQSLK